MFDEARKRWKLGPLVLMAMSWGCGAMAMGQGSMGTENSDDAKELNAPLAVGGTIQPEVEISMQGTAAPTLVLVSGHPEVVAAEHGRLIGRAPGVSAILVTTKEGVVLDFYHLWVEEASRATLHRLYADGLDMGELHEGLDLMVGESAVLTPKVYYEAQELAGIVHGKWSVEPPIAAVLREGVGERRRLVATQTGKAELTVTLANVAVKVPLRVVDIGGVAVGAVAVEAVAVGAADVGPPGPPPAKPPAPAVARPKAPPPPAPPSPLEDRR